jgi:hypothetical protein
MSQEHPITPPPELVQHWLGDYFGCAVSGELSESELYLATQAARWGADQELEACCAWLINEGHEYEHVALRDARRPQPLSLKELALETLRSMQIDPVILDGINVNKDVMDKYDILRRALESLPEEQ